MASHQLTNWSSGLFDCFDDTPSCCYGFWCCPCFACSTSGKFGENSCLPLCDILTPALLAACGIPLCVPPAAVTMRVAIRHKYGIKGSLCKDIITSCFCEWCSWCQMAREMKHHKQMAKAGKAQPDTVVVLQNQIINQPQHIPPQQYVNPPPTNPALYPVTPNYGPGPSGFVTQPGHY
ncbi:cornifelin-like [Genypterus blacodes]|uniref:cornifelin-like n=1 Tax=Genypterus blacodes TaxID=154954 RepID=UPI003F777B84